MIPELYSIWTADSRYYLGILLKEHGIELKIRNDELLNAYNFDFNRGRSHYVRMLPSEEFMKTKQPEELIRLIFEEAIETLGG